jgi:uncharacterized protein (DUF1684 family)
MWYNNAMRQSPTIIMLAFLVALTGCSRDAPEIDPSYQTEIEAQWAAREARLTADDGWLTLTGLFWLAPGANSVGSGEDSAVRLPDGPDEVASLVVGEEGAVTLVPYPGGDLMVNGETAVEQTLAIDTSGAPDLMRTGRVLFYLIGRGDRIGVRVKDPESPTRRNFHGLERYRLDPAFRVVALLEPYPEPKEVAIPTVIGEPSMMLAPGILEFEIDGESVSLEPYISKPGERDLFIVYRDATSGDTTYGAGRFLNAEISEGSNEVVLDFNLATNPPCAFTPYATCPLPTPENTLFVAIEAGERYSGAHH